MRPGLIASCIGVAVAALAVPAALIWAGPACADSWMLPETTTYLSPDKGCRLTIVPRDLENQLTYLEGKVDNVEKAGQRPGGNPQANATLERRLPDGRWERLWARALVNDVAPADALVSDGMDYVVTFDNWHSIGYGDDSIVIYDIAKGGVRTFSVETLLGAEYFAALPRSVSSVQWRGDKRIEGGQLVIDVVVPDESRSMGRENHVALAIDLASGKTSERSPGAWRKARASAERVNAAARAAEQTNRAARVAPLPGPPSHDELGWHSYLREAFWRVDPDWIEEYPATTVLLARGAPNYRDSVKWVGKHLETSGEGPEMFAAVDEADLIEVLAKVTARLRPGALHGKRVYIAASQGVHARLTALFAPSRATLTLLDPAKPIPQRPERLPRADGSLPTPFDFRKSEESP
jgi:hypothetical protein